MERKVMPIRPDLGCLGISRYIVDGNCEVVKVDEVWEERATYSVVVPGTPDSSDAVSSVVDGTAEGHWPVRLIECVDSMRFSSLYCGRHDEA